MAHWHGSPMTPWRYEADPAIARIVSSALTRHPASKCCIRNVALNREYRANRELVASSTGDVAVTRGRTAV